MEKATKVKQLNCTLTTKVGLLAEIAEAMAKAQVNISSIAAHESGRKAYFSFTTDSAAKAKRAMAKLGIEAEEKDGILVEMPNKPGELQKVAQQLSAAEINILETYGGSGAGRASSCFFSTSDNLKAVRILNNPPKKTARKATGRTRRPRRPSE
jgi:hypothetical protein